MIEPNLGYVTMFWAILIPGLVAWVIILFYSQGGRGVGISFIILGICLTLSMTIMFTGQAEMTKLLTEDMVKQRQILSKYDCTQIKEYLIEYNNTLDKEKFQYKQLMDWMEKRYALECKN